jgi:hypothetical protein
MTFDANAPTIYLNVDGALHLGRLMYDNRGQVTLDGGGKLFRFAPLLADLIAPYEQVQLVLTYVWIRVFSPAEIHALLPNDLLYRIVTCASLAEPHESATVAGTASPASILRHAIENRISKWIAVQNDSFPLPRRGRAHFLKASEQLALGSVIMQAKLTDWMQRNSVRQDAERDKIEDDFVTRLGHFHWDHRPARHKRQ